MPRVRLAPSPTGLLHVGSAHTFIFNARRNGGICHTIARNKRVSLDSLFASLNRLEPRRFESRRGVWNLPPRLIHRRGRPADRLSKI
jgi:hypothetical protein